MIFAYYVLQGFTLAIHIPAYRYCIIRNIPARILSELMKIKIRVVSYSPDVILVIANEFTLPQDEHPEDLQKQ